MGTEEQNGRQDAYIEIYGNQIEKLFKKIDELHDDVLSLKVKAGAWGACTAFIVSVAVGIVGWFVK